MLSPAGQLAEPQRVAPKRMGVEEPRDTDKCQRLHIMSYTDMVRLLPTCLQMKKVLHTSMEAYTDNGCLN